jgi:hypothetical protein
MLDKLQATASFAWLQFNHDMTVLTMPASLSYEPAFCLGRYRDCLFIGDPWFAYLSTNAELGK